MATPDMCWTTAADTATPRCPSAVRVLLMRKPMLAYNPEMESEMKNAVAFFREIRPDLVVRQVKYLDLGFYYLIDLGAWAGEPSTFKAMAFLEAPHGPA